MTPDQRDLMRLKDEGLTRAEIAERLGTTPSAIKKRLERARAAQARDQAIQSGMDAIGTGLTPKAMWIKTQGTDTEPARSILLTPPAMPDDTLDRIRAAFEGMQPAEPVEPPEKVMADLCAVWPIMDLHFGMRAWSRETGGPDYSTEIAARDLRASAEKLLKLTPFTAEAILILGGDTLHANDDLAQTPQSKHALDVDGRMYQVVEEAIDVLGYVASRLLSRSQKLTIRVLRGNHDPNSHVILAFAFKERFRNDPRVHVEISPRDIFMYRWGRVALFAHHGDKAPPERLSLYLADACPFWSDTRHRICLTGHIHHRQARDFGSIVWESLRAFCPPDAYAASMGFASRRAMQALILDRQDGIVLRAFDPVE